MYHYLDSLISIPVDASMADIGKIFEFVTEVFKLCLKWIQVFPQYKQVYKLSLQYQNLFLVDLDSAICSCSNEIFDMLHKCFGHCERSNKFFKNHKQSINY